KSNENLASAQLLTGEDLRYYNASTQCSYYGCIQIIKHLLIHKIYSSEAEIMIKFNDYKSQGKKGNSHAFYINEVYKRLKSDGYKSFAKTFNQKMFELKTLREISAYQEKLIIDTESEEALRVSRDLVKNLKSIYKLP